ncbi:uncharacterized protein HKW66_Vig0087740 [Vigna angularis]|uniref:Uncharacterized protein n=3 Tax=Phaseolus angularis TaxID=3914 RepID=A0A8T0KLC2_PHAAN|nr:uncharacterized protein HKW66_Vig0087740 [Vigna angularis]BAT79966.1 hypothetical protein VIGAN_02291700 [Vigna angularis var. angularis]
MASNLVLLFCLVAVMNSEVVPSSARNLKSNTSDENRENHDIVEAYGTSNYKVEKKEEKNDKNQVFPPIIPLPPLPFPPPSLPLPSPNVPGLPWPGPSLPLPPVPIPHRAHFSAPSPPT